MKKRLLTFVPVIICFLLSPGFSNDLFSQTQYISTSDALARPSNQIVIVSGSTYMDNNGSYEYTYDARNWTTNSIEKYPVKVGNNNPGTRQVWVGGEVNGLFPTDLTWKDMKINYDGTGILMRSKHYLVIDGIRLHNVMDGIRPQDNSGVYKIANVHATYIRDDAIESDEMMGGLIEDCLFDGVYMFLSQQGSATWRTDLDSLYVKNNLVRLEPMPYSTNVNGNLPHYQSTYGVNADRHGELFKWHGPGDAPVIVENCIFYVPQHSVNGATCMAFPTFAGCRYSNNILLWTGGGSYPGTLPATGVTEYNLLNSTQEEIDQIWQNAKNDWLARHYGSSATIPTAPSSLSATAVSSSQVDLSWTDNSSNEQGFKIERKTGTGSYSEIVQLGANVTSYSNTGLSGSTTYTYRVRAYNTAGNSAYSNEAGATTQSASLPSPWVNADIGAVGAAGSASYSSGVFTVDGSGADIWGTADEFQYVYQQVSGDVEIIARVASLENTNDFAKGAVMIREDLTAGSKNAKMTITPTKGFKFEWRATTGGTSSYTNGTATNTPPNNWVRLVRSGSNFTGYQSSDGTSWTQVGTTQSISMTSSVYVGLAVCSVNDGVLCTATFDNVQVTGGATIPTAPSSLSATALSSSQVDLSWTDNSSNEQGFKIERKTGTGSYSEIVQLGANVTSYSNTGLSGSTTYTYRVRAYNTAGNSAYSNEAGATTQSASLPSPWVNADIGAVGAAGSASYSSGVFTVDGSGADIWGTADEFQYVYQQVSGDVEIIARVASLENTNDFAKGAVMIREDLTAGSKNAKMTITPTKGFKFEWRATTGGTSSYTNGTATNTPPNNWVRLVRSGSNFTGYQSSDGTSWTQVGTTQSISMTSSVYVGLAVCSVNDGVLCTATFDNVQVTGGATIPTAPSSLSATAVSSSQVDLSWTDNSSNEQGFKIERKTGTGSYSEIVQLGANVTSYSNTGLSGSTTYTYRVRAYNTAGNSAYSNEAGATTQSASLPSPWVNADIGAVGAAGSASYSSGVFTVDGSGADIWGTADEFQYVYQQVSGDVEIIARVASLENTNDFAKGAVMIREDLTAGSKNAKMTITPTKGFKFEWRATTGGTSSYTNGTATNTPPNNWVRLVRSGSNFTGYQSSDGTSWTQVGTTQSISMTSSVYVGLAVCSVNDGVLCTATFDNVQVTEGASTIDPTMKVWWKYDETSGTTASDATGNGRSGSLLNGLQFTGVTGQFGKALTFDYVDDVVRYNQSPGISAYPFSLCAWVKTSSTQKQTAVFLGDATTDGKYFTIGMNSGKGNITARNTTHYEATGSTVISNGAWHLIVGVFESSTSRRLYVDGVQVATSTNSVPFVSTINRFSSGSNDRWNKIYMFDGSIDDVRLYGKALSASEVSEIFQGLKSAQIATSIESLSQSIQLEVYPNPLKDGNLTVTTSRNVDNARILIYGIDGKLVYRTTFSGFSTEIDNSLFDNGVYILKVESSLGTNIKRFIKQ
jgi:regulation of enolase protein 1 (concanavalin A-like superfamily)/transcriptional regulator CtsR